MAYSDVTIGGVACLVDPDSVSESVQNLMHITRAMSGGNYVTSYGSGVGSLKTVTITGAMLGAAAAEALINLAKSKAGITVSMLTGTFVVVDASRNPMKPRVPYVDGSGLDGGILYSYSISLREV